MDLQELQLKLAYLKAYKQYIDYVKDRCAKSFITRLGELGKTRYKYETKQEIKDVEDTRRVQTELGKACFRELSMIYHPDRPGGNSNFFVKIQDLYEKGQDKILEQILNFPGSDPSDIVTLAELEEEVDRETNMLYWLWAHSSCKSIYESMYQTEEEFQRDQEKKVEIELIITVEEQLASSESQF